MKITTRSRHQRGTTLLELLIALGLGSFLVLGILNVFLSTNESAKLEKSLARLQENGRFAIDLLTEDLRRTRYSGCNSIGGIITDMAKNVNYTGLRGFERRGTTPAWVPDPGSATIEPIETTALNGSDVLNLQLAMPLPSTMLETNITPSTTGFTVSANPGCRIEQNDLLVLSNCISAHLLRVTNEVSCINPASSVTLEHNADGNDLTRIEPGYRDNETTEIMEFRDVVWYVADTGRDRGDYDVRALYRRENNTAGEEMIEGIENLQILFGVQTGENTRFLPARDVHPDWDQVTSVRIAVMLQSFESVRNAEDNAEYQLLDESIGPTSEGAHAAGLALRQVFRTTVVLRNTAFDV